MSMSMTRKEGPILNTSRTGNSSLTLGISYGSATRTTRYFRDRPSSSIARCSTFKKRCTIDGTKTNMGNPQPMRSKTTIPGITLRSAWDSSAVRSAFLADPSCASVTGASCTDKIPITWFPWICTRSSPLFENISLTSSKNAIGKWWGVKLGDLRGKGVRTGTRTRRKVPKTAVYEVLAQYGSYVGARHLEGLIQDLQDLIRGCPLVEWHGRLFDDDHAFLSNQVIDNLSKINSPAVKAYLWLPHQAGGTGPQYTGTEVQGIRLGPGGCTGNIQDHGEQLQGTSDQSGIGGNHKNRI